MQEFVFTPHMAVWISVAIILFAGMLMGAYRLLKLLWGYSNDGLFGAFEKGKGFISDAGSLPLSILRIGIFSTIAGLILLSSPSQITRYLIICGVFALLQHLLATIIARRLPVQRLGGVLGGLIGAISGATLSAAVAVLIGMLVSPTVFGVGLTGLGVLSGLIGMLPGIILGGKLADGEFEGSRIGNIIEEFAREIGVWVLIGVISGWIIGTILIWNDIETLGESVGESLFLGLLIGGPAGGFAGTLYGSLVDLFFLAARMLSRFIYTFLKPLLIQLRFKQIICRSCLRYTLPLDSRYELGRRYCEHCQKVVEHTKIPGKVVVTFGNYPKASEPEQRIFVLADPDFEKKEQPIDVSEVYIVPKTTDKRLFERFITYIVNHPPRDDLASVQIVYQGELDDLGVNLKNVLHNTFEHVQQIH